MNGRKTVGLHKNPTVFANFAPMKVLTIIVSYNFEAWLEKCLGSLRQSTYPTDVLVVDNASQDGTVACLQTEFPEVRLIAGERNLGFGAANNLGFQIALNEGYDAVFLLNQDAYVCPETLSVLVAESLAHPQVGILSPVHLNGDASALDFGFATYAKLANLADLQGVSHLQYLPFVNAALWLVPTAVLRQVGGFCPLFYHYGEDKDLANRMLYHGYRIAYSPKAFALHHRENRPSTPERRLFGEYIYWLTEYVDVRKSFVKAFAYSILASQKKAMQHLLKGNLSATWKYWGIGVKLLLQTCKVLRYRCSNSKRKIG